MTKLLNSLFERYLPMPKVLAAALLTGTVRIAKSERGEVAYFIAAHCRNAEAVKHAIAQRNAWELAATVVFGATGVVLLVGVVQQVIR